MALLGEMLGDNALGRGMDARIGDLIEPLAELRVEIVEVSKLRPGRSPRGCNGTGARPFPWFWPGMACTPLAGNRSGGQTRAGCDCRRCGPSRGCRAEDSPHTVVEYLFGTPPSASNAPVWQRSSVCRSWCTDRPHNIGCGRVPRENSQMIRSTPGSSVNTVRKSAKSTCAWRPGGVSKRTSNAVGSLGRASRRKSFTAV